MNLKELLEMEDGGKQYELPELPYAYDALEPHIDEETMFEHHTKHQQKYVDNLNKEFVDTPHLIKPLEELFQEIESHNVAIRNNAGGVWNHTFLWDLLSSESTTPNGKLATSITSEWDSLENFMAEFKDMGLKRFGSGWVWLVLNIKTSKLEIITTPNQDNPLMLDSLIPIIGCDLWEHAYYLKHKSNRGAWIDNFFKVLNWNTAASNYMNATNKK
jgi:Fe-Mn family superoxide dismutase